MKKEDFDIWTYKGFTIMKFEHPKLLGKYELFKTDESIKIRERYTTLSECRQKINTLLTTTNT